MSRAWMPIYWGDYLRDTGHLTTIQHGAYLLLIAHCWQHERLPADDKARAAIARCTLAEWQKCRTEVEAFFRPDGTHKRIEQEINKTERKILQRAMAGRKGGIRSGITRAARSGTRSYSWEANEAKRKQNGSKMHEANEANTEAKPKQPRTIHKEDITSTFSVAATPLVDNEDLGLIPENSFSSNSAGTLATALPTGALAPPPTDRASGAEESEAPAEPLSELSDEAKALAPSEALLRVMRAKPRR